MSLQAGDTCVIIDHPNWFDGPNKRSRLGKIVILISGPHLYPQDPRFTEIWGSYWKVSGITPGMMSPLCLRKIPPAPMDDDVNTEDTLIMLSGASK
jgi:hypothetical protein